MKNKLITVIILCALLILCAVGYKLIIERTSATSKFENELVNLAEKNEVPIFYVQKIMLYSSAGITDNSENKNLSNIDISQFTDIAIYLKNASQDGLTAENTINKLWVDEITLVPNEKWNNTFLTYKNPYDFGKFIQNNSIGDTKIEYKLLQKNDENSEELYNQPTFYTDCSNPITLSYTNKNIVTGAKVQENTSIATNGKILSQAQVDLEELNYMLSFVINIENNLGQLFSYKMKLNIYLDAGDNELYNGYLLQEKDLVGREYGFFRIK
ncbi:MAG: hypothetical protein IKT41_05420 [Clostridia bacterium]|nr:hypothetical protein [Clostridia bacterium]